MALSCVVSCGVLSSDFAIEGIEIMDGIESDTVRVEMVLRNDSGRDIVIDKAKISVQIKGEDLVSFMLIDGIEVSAEEMIREVTRWRVQRDDPATLYAMRRYPIERYIDKLTFGYEIGVEGVARRKKVFMRRRLRAKDLDINFEKLLR